MTLIQGFIRQGLPEAEFHEPGEKIVEASSNGHNGLVKKAVKKRTAQPPDGVPKMKRIKIDRKDDALYQQYVLSRYKIPRAKKDQVIGFPHITSELPWFIKATR